MLRTSCFFVYSFDNVDSLVPYAGYQSMLLVRNYKCVKNTLGHWTIIRNHTSKLDGGKKMSHPTFSTTTALSNLLVFGTILHAHAQQGVK